MVNRRAFVCFLLMAVVCLARDSSLASDKPVDGNPYYFPGQLLVASAGMRDPRFRKSVIFMIRHGPEGAHGIIINKALAKGPVAALMQRFGMKSSGATRTVTLHYGGPVNPRGAFILHSSDYTSAKSRAVDDKFSFTTDITILRAIADGNGPLDVLIALGYAGWGADQLETEVARGDWSLVKATEDLVFGKGRTDVWDRIIDASRVPL